MRDPRWALAIGVVGLALAPTARAGVVINELVPDLVGSDGGFEWIEILNTGPAPVQLDGWTIERGDSTLALKFTFPAYEIQPGEHVVVADPYVVGGTFTLPIGINLTLANATASADVVRILDASGAVVDTIVYGTPNTDSWLDDDGLVATSLAPKPVAGEALARVPDGADTDASAVDVVVQAPTMGAPNAAGTPPTDTGGAAGTAPGTVLINELLPNPASTDKGLEWLEIVNVGAADVELAGWTIEAGSSSYATRYTFPAYPLAPGERVVVGDELVAFADFVVPTGDSLTMGNASDADAVRIVDATGVVIDTVVYGTPNTNGWLDDDGIVAASLAPEPGDDEVLARLPDGVDTNASGVDLQLGVATPGAVNAAVATTPPDTGDTGTPPVVEVVSPFAGQVVVNELVPDPADADAGKEWIEILNVSGAEVDLDGWAIERITTTSWGNRHTFAGVTLAAGQRLVVGEAEVLDADIVIETTLDFGNASNSGDGVRIVDAAGLAVDTVVYGPDNSNAIVDDSGAIAVSVVPGPGADESLARVPDGADTDASGVDFVVIAAPTMGSANLDPADACTNGAEADGVVVNELDTNSTGAEWVEIYNGTSAVVALSGWTLGYGTSSFGSTVAIPEGVTLEPGAYYVVGAIPDADLADPLGLGNASSSSDGVQLVDCVGGIVDTVVYGTPNTDGLVDDSGAVATSLAPTPASGATLARIEDGYDTDASEVDFSVQTTPTPGAANPVVVPIVCVPSTGDVVVNEVLPNPAETDDNKEWIELYNRGDAEVSVAGWVLSVGTQDWEDDTIVLPGGTVVPAGGWLVVGGSSVDEVDVVYPFELGNGSDGDGVQLRDCEGAVVDTVIYGDSAADLLTDDEGLVVEPYGEPDDDEAIARVEDGVDTNAAEDWDERGTPTPGATNLQVSSGGGDYEGPGGGCGCGASGPPESAGAGAPPTGDSGCSTVPLPLRGFEGLIAAAVALRRRRR